MVKPQVPFNLNRQQDNSSRAEQEPGMAKKSKSDSEESPHIRKTKEWRRPRGAPSYQGVAQISGGPQQGQALKPHLTCRSRYQVTRNFTNIFLVSTSQHDLKKKHFEGTRERKIKGKHSVFAASTLRRWPCWRDCWQKTSLLLITSSAISISNIIINRTNDFFSQRNRTDK